MKTKNLFLALVAFSTTIAFIGCKKEGAAGKDGKDGNANVTSLTLTTSSWTWDATNKWRYSVWTGVTALSSEVCSGGAVMVYQNTTGGYVALPLTINISGTISEHDFFEYNTGNMYIFIENSDLSDPIAQIPIPTEYKLVCIPPAGMIQHPNVDLRNYNEVCRTFNLK